MTLNDILTAVMMAAIVVFLISGIIDMIIRQKREWRGTGNGSKSKNDSGKRM